MTLLLLAGTREARELSFLLPQDDLIASLAGATQRPAALGGQLRVGGFGGVEGLKQFLRAKSIQGVIDATHPFAAQMSRHAAEACAALACPVLQVLRPPWPVETGWTVVPELAHAADVLRAGTHVFLATGRGSLPFFEARRDVRFTARVIDDVSAETACAHVSFLISRPPFSVEEEVETLTRLGVDTIVVRNSGGLGGIEKIRAADRLGLEVIMVDRPQLPDVPRVETVDAAVAYVREHRWLDG